MNRSFKIIDGIVYLDKVCYQQAQQVDNCLSKLTGSICEYMFKKRPTITTGIESVTIDFHNIDAIEINKDPVLFVQEIRLTYQNRIRGHIVIDEGAKTPSDILINKY